MPSIFHLLSLPFFGLCLSSMQVSVCLCVPCARVKNIGASKDMVNSLWIKYLQMVMLDINASKDIAALVEKPQPWKVCCVHHVSIWMNVEIMNIQIDTCSCSTNRHGLCVYACVWDIELGWLSEIYQTFYICYVSILFTFSAEWISFHHTWYTISKRIKHKYGNPAMNFSGFMENKNFPPLFLYQYLKRVKQHE